VIADRQLIFTPYVLCVFSVILHINPVTGSKVSRVRGKKTRSGVHEGVLSLVKEMAVNDFLSQ